MDQCVENMVQKIKENEEILKWFMDFKPNENEGYLFSDNINLSKIEKMVDDDGHSASSFALCLRLAKKEINKKKIYL